MSRKSRGILIGCGMVLLLTVCVAGILAVGGLGALAAIFGPDPEGLTVETTVRPSVVTMGETFDLTVTAGNEGSRPLVVTEIDLPRSLTEGALLTEITPADRGRTQLGAATTYAFAREVPPGERREFVFTFQALAAGDYRGNLDVVVGPRRKITPLRVVVEPPVDLPESTSLDPDELDVPYQAVVQILTRYEEDGQVYDGWTGSGSIVSPDGLILTNAHVVLPDRYYSVDDLLVALTEHDDQAPVLRYHAEVLQADAALDIAVIRLTTDLDGNRVDPEALDLPTIPIGDSDSLRLGDTLFILGYPGIGGETITLTVGEVSGFTTETDRGERAFIKTSGTIAGGNSGGMAANAQGELIGVPTQLGYGGDDQYVDCRVLADTNRDGVIDEEDNCVPTGGFINALRPINLAMPLVEAARRGEVAIHTEPEETVEMAPAGAELFRDDFSDPSSGWDSGQGENYAVGYRDGRYEIEVLEDNYIVWSNPGESFDDVVVTVEAVPAGATGEGDFGVICRYQDGDNYYALEISEDGYAIIWKMEAGEYVPLADWEQFPVIPQDGSSVTLRAACAGETLTLGIGEMQLLEAQDASFARGDVGLIAGTLEVPELVVAFDDFVVQEP